MRRDNYNPVLQIIADQRDAEIRASILELREQDKMAVALRAAIKAGIRIEDLSEASGLSCDQIRRRLNSKVQLDGDLNQLLGC